MKVEIITPERQVYSGEGYEVTLPTLEGIIGIRDGHLPLITLLKPGEVTVKKDESADEHLAIAGGFAQVFSTHVTVMADSAEHSAQLNEEAIQAAVERAKIAKAEAADEHALGDATAHLEAQLARLKVARRKKSRGDQHVPPSST